MTTLTLDVALDAPIALAAPGDVRGGRRDGEPAPEPSRAAAGHGRRTLDELIVGVWEDLSAHHAVACPVCGHSMSPRYGSGPAPVGGRCTACGTRLE